MKRVTSLFLMVLFALASCTTSNPIFSYTPGDGARGNSAKGVQQTGTAVPDSTPSYDLPTPVAPTNLPHDLSVEIIYIQPPENCANKNDPNETCSTRQGQSTNGDFTLKAGQCLVMTGDKITITNTSGKLLIPRPNLTSNHDLWVVCNTNDKDEKLHMNAPFGSFRGYFATEDGKWSPEQIAHLRDLHLERFMLPPQPRAYTPTPVANCDKNEGCPHVNIRVVVILNGQIQTESGFYQITNR